MTAPLRWSGCTHARPVSTSWFSSGQRGQVELGSGVEPAGAAGGRGGKHAIATDDDAGALLADQQVVAERVEAVDVEPVVGLDEVSTELVGEDVVTQALSGGDLAGVGGQQDGVGRGGGGGDGGRGDQHGRVAHGPLCTGPGSRHRVATVTYPCTLSERL